MIDLISLIPSTIMTCVIGVIGYTYKRGLDRIDTIEEKLSKRITEANVRKLLEDKIEPVREDLQEIKASIAKLTDVITDVRINGNH